MRIHARPVWWCPSTGVAPRQPSVPRWAGIRSELLARRAIRIRGRGRGWWNSRRSAHHRLNEDPGRDHEFEYAQHEKHDEVGRAHRDHAVERQPGPGHAAADGPDPEAGPEAPAAVLLSAARGRPAAPLAADRVPVGEHVGPA